MAVFYEQHTQTFDERAFTNAGHAGDAQPNRFAGVRQYLVNNFARQLMMVGARAFNQCDGLRQQPAILFVEAFDQYVGVSRIHFSCFEFILRHLKTL
jgi:predicted RNA-binding protein with PUA-like domain